MTRIDNSYLLGLWGLNTTGGSSFSTAASTAPRSQPTAPWADSVSSSQPKQSDLLRSALAGRRFIDESSHKLDVRTKTSSEYKTLFAMHTGLQMLEALTLRAMDKNVSSSQMSQLQKRFDAGLKEVSNYLATAGAEVGTVRMINGVSSTKAQSTTVIPRDNHVYKTGAIHTGSLTEPVEAFQGDVQFDVTIRALSGTQTIGIDLSEMGGTPRTMDGVISHINGKLEEAGVQTRFSRQDIAGEERKLKVGERTITLPSAGDSWGLTVTGNTVETVGFQPRTSSTAVQVVQGTGSNVLNQVLKFDPNASTSPEVGEKNWVDGRIDQSKLPEGISTVRASAAAADGGMWIVADARAGNGGQSIRGQSDVMLLKLDSAGQVVISRGLGAASQASGYAISVADDGRVAVAGSVTGGIIPGQSVANKSLSDSFVTVFDDNGVEQWTHSRGARAADEATAVSFGADGKVYVAGRAQSSMPGALSEGGWDGYVQAFSETQSYSQVTTASAVGTQQFGTADDDNVQAMTVDGDNLYTAGVENGKFVVRQFQIDGNGAPQLVSSRDLGASLGGEIANIAVSNGRVIVSGATRNDSLSAGSVTNAHAGGSDVFVASLSSDLNASATDKIAYYGSEGEDTAADVKVVNGEVWLTGTWNGSRTTSVKTGDNTTTTTAYLARLDVDTGQTDWSRTWTGEKDKATPMALAVSANGSSVLDKLGLPQGELVQESSTKVVESTGLRAGDRFYVTNPNTGRKSAVTIDKKDTLQTLATKIENASGRNLKVTISTERGDPKASEGDSRVLAGGGQYLSITNADGRMGALISAGESGRDALAGLGLTSGYVGKTDTDRKIIGVDIPESLNLNSNADIGKAKEYIQSAMRAVREGYRAMSPTMLNAGKNQAVGQPSAYMQSQIANYQAALARLTG